MNDRRKTEIVQFHLNEVGDVDDLEIEQVNDFIKEKKHEIHYLQTQSKEILSSSHLDVNTKFLGKLQEFSAEINHYLEQCKKHPKLFQKEITALEAYVHSTNELVEKHQERLKIEVKMRDQTQFQLAKLKIKSKEPSNSMDSTLIKLFTDKAPRLLFVATMEPESTVYWGGAPSKFESLGSQDSKVLGDHNQLLNAFYTKFTRADPDHKVALMNEKTFHDLKHAVGITRAHNEKKLKEIDHITNRRDKKDIEIYAFLYPLVPYDLLSDKAKVSKSFHEVVQGYIEAFQKPSTIPFMEKLSGPDLKSDLRVLLGNPATGLEGGSVELQDQLEKRVQQREFYKFRGILGKVIENNLVVDYKQPPKSPTSPTSPLIPSEPITPTSPPSFTSQPKFLERAVFTTVSPTPIDDLYAQDEKDRQRLQQNLLRRHEKNQFDAYELKTQEEIDLRTQRVIKGIKSLKGLKKLDQYDQEKLEFLENKLEFLGTMYSSKNAKGSFLEWDELLNTPKYQSLRKDEDIVLLGNRARHPGVIPSLRWQSLAPPLSPTSPSSDNSTPRRFTPSPTSPTPPSQGGMFGSSQTIRNRASTMPELSPPHQMSILLEQKRPKRDIGENKLYLYIKKEGIGYTFRHKGEPHKGIIPYELKGELEHGLTQKHLEEIKGYLKEKRSFLPSELTKAILTYKEKMIDKELTPQEKQKSSRAYR